MYFKISKKEFYSALSTVSRAISANSPLPLLSGIKIDVKEDEICLTGSDADISIKKTLKKSAEMILDIKDTGSVVIEARNILELVRKIDADEIEVETIDGTLTKFSWHTAEFKLNGMNVADYPAIDFSQPEKRFALEADILMKIITQTCFAASDKETRPVLTGVNFKCDGKQLECVATDSYRLARKIVTLETDNEFNITIPAKSLNEVGKSSNEIARAFEKQEKILIAVSDKKAQFWLEDTIIQTRLIDGIYPETNRLIPTDFKHELVVDARDILNAIDRAQFIKSDGISIVKLSANSDEVFISTKSQEVGSSVEKIDTVSYQGEPIEISFSSRYVLGAVRVLGGTVVKISFSGEMKPFIIQNVDDDSILQLVLPVRTYN
ncbi:MAG: DNA polymerase III subunit beta [Erysipelotrichaceae bacterium]|nr:DNA polymerase III subunit beta [Erysipelotrichaceae bacterium]MDD3923553.1 DNA polymerase III subunit beta [Erysipelotrichaceae bacterium]MDD4642775.1 DNA polymerase III subunit beta [Erysipelotrichaceae bacterium]